MPHEHALFARQPAGHLEGVVVLTWTTSSMISSVQDVRDEAGADALDLVRPGSALPVMTADASPARPRCAWNAGLRGLMTSPTPVIVPPVPTPADEDVDLAVGVGPDLLGRGAAVDLGVGRVLELLRHERVGVVADDLLGLARSRPFIPSAPGVKNELGAEAP